MKIKMVFFFSCMIVFTVFHISSKSVEFESLHGYSGVSVFEDDFHGGIVQLYVVKRLERVMQIVATIDQKKVFQLLCSEFEGGLCDIFNGGPHFEYEAICDCQHQIEREKSLLPLMELWSKIKKQSIKKKEAKVTVAFLREFSLLILVVYRTIITACSPIAQLCVQKNLLTQVFSLLFGDVGQLHAFEVLSIIENLSNEIPKLLEKYELTNKDLSWSEWLKKYWWLTPIAATAITLEVIFLYQVAVGKKELPGLRSAMRFFSGSPKQDKEAESCA